MASPEIGCDAPASGIVVIGLRAFLDNLVVLVGVGLARVRRTRSLLGHARVNRPRLGEQVVDLSRVLWYGVRHELDRRSELHPELLAYLRSDQPGGRMQR